VTRRRRRLWRQLSAFSNNQEGRSVDILLDERRAQDMRHDPTAPNYRKKILTKVLKNFGLLSYVKENYPLEICSMKTKIHLNIQPSDQGAFMTTRSSEEKYVTEVVDF
jgi:hypothetical protein